MKPFLKKLFIFISVFVVVWIIGVFVWFRYMNPKYPLTRFLMGSHITDVQKDIKKNYKNQSIDYLIVGSSHAYCSFDTDIFRQNQKIAINYGSAIQTPIQTRFLVDDFIKRYKKPKYIIYEVYAGPLQHVGTESEYDFLFNYQTPYFSNLATTLFKRKAYIGLLPLNGLIYNATCFTFGLELNPNAMDMSKKENFKYVQGGFRSYSKKLNLKDASFSKENWNINLNKKHFEQCLQYIKSLGVQPILVYAPIPKPFYNAITNHTEIDAYYKSLGFPYYNFNLLMEMDLEKDFFDYDGHLNSEGASKFTNKLIETLKKDGYL